MKFFIIHGTYGHPGENWFPWLKNELEKQGHEVIVPKFPTPENQSLENWMKVFEPYLDKIDSETVFVAHSLGPAFVLSVLEKTNIKIKACFFVAGFIGLLGNEQVDPINKTFVTKEFDWDKIKQNCGQFYLYNSNDDSYVPISRGEELKDKLNGELTKFDKAGHFNEAAGFKEFPQLLEDIKKIG